MAKAIAKSAKTKAGKPSKAPAKKAPAKAIKKQDKKSVKKLVVVKPKATIKKVVKPTPKKVVKAAPKKMAKVVAKKPVKKIVGKPVKKVVKPIAKKAVKPIPKKVTKQPVKKAIVKKSPVKVVKKIVKPIVKKVTKSAPKKVSKPVAKKAVVKVLPKKTIVKAAVKTAAKPAKSIVKTTTVKNQTKNKVNKPVKNQKAMKGKETMQSNVKSSIKKTEKQEKEVLSQREVIKKSIETEALPVPKKKAKPATEKKETKKSKTSATTIERPQAKNEMPEVKTLVREGGVDDADDALRISIENKMRALFKLQMIDSQIDKLKIVCGELPLEVQDLEDTMAGLLTRVENFKKDIINFEAEQKVKQQAIKDSQALIKKYEEQKNKVRNNREYDSITKEIEFQTLEIQLCEKKINEIKYMLEVKKEAVATSSEEMADLQTDLDVKLKELKEITSETEKEEKELLKKSEELQKQIEERLLSAYSRIRENAQNGLAVVKVERDACGGCFNKIPPQRQLDIKLHKKIIVCEYCGRIMIDDVIANELLK